MRGGLILLVLLLSGCNALCLMSADPDIWGQKGDGMTNLAWYGGPACVAGDVLP